MMEAIKKSTIAATSVLSTILTFAPESVFSKIHWLPKDLLLLEWIKSHSEEIETIGTRVALFCLVWVLISIGFGLYYHFRRKKVINHRNYSISVEYGDLLAVKKAKKVINFDECFSTKVGPMPADVDENSICGQYLKNHPIDNMQELITCAGLTPLNTKSRYHNQECYKPGSLVPLGDSLLMAFAKLDENGSGTFFSREEYCQCLDHLWQEIDKHFGHEDVCIPILGSGRTRFSGGSGESLSQQELLDLMIYSYTLSSHKIKNPYKLRIICRKAEGFSLNNIMQ